MTLFFAIFCSSAFAWEVRLDEAGQELSWQTDEIPYSINAKGALGLSQAAVETLVAAATRNWSAPLEGNLVFNQQGSTEVKQPSHADSVNAIYFDDAWPQDPSLLALTYVWSNPQGEIIGFDLALNATDHLWATDGRTDANDLLNTLSHEIGHALGIDHSPEVALATMYPSSPAGEIQKRDLHADDVAAATYLYTPNNTAESAGCTTVGANGAPWMWTALIALFASFRSRETLS